MNTKQELINVANRLAHILENCKMSEDAHALILGEIDALNDIIPFVPVGIQK